jgi:hypothetical protein
MDGTVVTLSLAEKIKLRIGSSGNVGHTKAHAAVCSTAVETSVGNYITDACHVAMRKVGNLISHTNNV